MRYVNALALLLVIVGGVNWLLVGIAKFDLVAALTGNDFVGRDVLSRIVYGAVGIAGVYAAVRLAGAVRTRPAIARAGS